jgi:hypothetical protein
MLYALNNFIINLINNLEIYFVPICFGLGFVGNLTGSCCILFTNNMRKRTPFFILSTIGFVDNIFLISQLQRWFAIHFNQNLYLVNHSLCKFYLLLIRSSVLITSSLILALTMASVVRLYLGSVCLSTNTKGGQLLSKLSVSYIIALGMAFRFLFIF